MMAGIAAESIRKAEKKKGDSFTVAFFLNSDNLPCLLPTTLSFL